MMFKHLLAPTSLYYPLTRLRNEVIPSLEDYAFVALNVVVPLNTRYVGITLP